MNCNDSSLGSAQEEIGADRLDKEIKSKLYHQINEITTEDDMIKIVRHMPIRFFEIEKEKTMDHNAIIEATVQGLEEHETYHESFIEKMNSSHLPNEIAHKFIRCFMNDLFSWVNKKYITTELAIEAIQANHQYYWNLPDSVKSDKEVIYATLLKNAQMIQYFPQTPDYCMLALILDHTCYDKIREPTWLMKKYVLDRIAVEEEIGGAVLFEF